MSRDLCWAQNLARPNLPKYVLRVMRTVASSKLLDGVSGRSKEILYYLSSLVDANNRESVIFATKPTIAKKTGCSAPTVYRALRELEEAGYIFRHEQKLHPDSGFFRIGEISFTDKFFEIVSHPGQVGNLSSPNVTFESGSSSKSVQSSEMDGQSEEIQEEPSINVIDNTNQTKTLNPKISNASSVDKTGKYRLPESLQWVAEQGLMTHQQIVSAMRKAKQVGQRLQDLLEAKRDVIESGEIRNLGGYLWALLSSGEDFGYRARQIREAETQREKATNLASDMQDLLSRMAGKALRVATGGMWKLYTPSMAEFFDANGCRRGLQPINVSWFEQIKASGYDLITNDGLVMGGAR